VYVSGKILLLNFIYYYLFMVVEKIVMAIFENEVFIFYLLF